ncbi:hypothetical protein TNCV_2203921 [Trichonephila clavipes]|nr:hypothetical protein TNCV_2203921 [Trichonephila clavipes]
MILCVAELLERSKGEKQQILGKVRHRSQIVSMAVEVILKLLECVVDGAGSCVLEVADACRRTDISSLSARKRRRPGAPGSAKVCKSVSCCLRRSRSPEKLCLCQTTCGEEEAIRRTRPVVCVRIDQTAPYCPFAMVS